MSDVRLSNGSPTLERTEIVQGDQPKPSACRNLFGSVNHEELKRDLNGHLRELEEAASTRWGFDFSKHKPLTNGRLQWELVDAKDVPDFYNRPPRKEKGLQCGINNLDLNGNHNPKEDPDQMECMEQCNGLRKRPAILDTSTQNKRSHTSPEEISTEHTPRKTSPRRQT